MASEDGQCPPRLSRRHTLQVIGTSTLVGTAGCLSQTDRTDEEPEPDIDDPETHEFEVEELASGFAHPWAVEPIPGESALLVTERVGGLHRVDLESGETTAFDGLPEVYDRGQGGLLDLAFHPQFPEEPLVYFTYASAAGDGSTTALGRGWLDLENAALLDVEELFAAHPGITSTAHYGSRVLVGPDEKLYVTVGDRNQKDFGPEHVSQDRTNTLGATLRFDLDGSIPADNPFVDDPDVADPIYTYGHRNAQGMTVHPGTGDIWQSEHGEEDGDELNVIRGGENYGWPVAHTGCHYGTTDPVGDDPFDRDDIVDPVYYWECQSGGFPPAGMAFYTGEAFPAWEQDLFVGNLAGQYLGRFIIEDPGARDPGVSFAERLLTDRGWRIRDVTRDPVTAGLVVCVDDTDAPIVRLIPLT